MNSGAIQTIFEQRVVAVIRLDDVERDILNIAQALLDGGVKVLEVTLTSKSAMAALRLLTDWAQGRSDQSMAIGAGSVRRLEEARAAVSAGAYFLVSPGLVRQVLDEQDTLGVPVIPGVFTPSEAMAADELGAAAIKLFPASLGGPSYLKSLLAPLPGLKLIPTGGIALGEIPAYLARGAAAVGVGTSLVPPDLVDRRNWEELRRLAEEAVHQAHSSV